RPDPLRQQVPARAAPAARIHVVELWLKVQLMLGVEWVFRRSHAAPSPFRPVPRRPRCCSDATGGRPASAAHARDARTAWPLCRSRCRSPGRGFVARDASSNSSSRDGGCVLVSSSSWLPLRVFESRPMPTPKLLCLLGCQLVGRDRLVKMALEAVSAE